MDIDKGLLGAIVREGMSTLHEEGVRREMLAGEYRLAFDFIENHWKENSKLPDPETLRKETGVDVMGGPREPLKFWAGEVKKRNLFNVMQEEVAPFIEKMEKREPMDAVKMLESAIINIRKRSVVAGSRPVSIFSQVGRIMDAYEQAKLGLTGIPTPWPSLNRITMGWQKEDLAIFAARPGSGKTFLLLMIAKWAWQEKYKVLCGSTEMSLLGMARRASAMATKTSYGKLRHGNLSTMEEEIFRREMDKIKDDDRFLIMGDGFDVTLESIEAAIIEQKPDLVLLDGIYLFKSGVVKAKDRLSRIAELIEVTKGIAKRHKVPVIATTQMNRSNKNEKGQGQKAKGDLERLAFSDNIGMVADYVFFLHQTKDMRENKEMEIIPAKTRESDMLDPILINWNFEFQDFSQKDDNKNKPVEVPQQIAPGDDPF